MRRALLLGVLTLGLAAGWWWLSEGVTRGETVPVVRGDVQELLWVPGWLEAVNGVVEVSSTAVGVVTSLPVAPGEHVEVGQVVATIDQEVVATKAAQAQAALRQAEASQTTVRAPVAGTVIRHDINVGELVGGAVPRPLLAIADLSRLQVRLEIDEADIERVRVGQPAFVTTAATGDRRLPGTLHQVEFQLGRRKVPLDDPRSRTDTRVLEVVMALEDPGPLKLQQRVDAAVVLAEAKGVLLVPVAAVHHDHGKPYVRVLGPATSAPRDITVGLTDGSVVEARSGLKEGEQLVLDPAVH